MESLLIDHSRRRIGKVALRTGQADRDPARHDQDEEAERAPRGGLVHAGESRSGKRCCVLSQVSGLPTSDRRYRNTARRAAIIAMMRSEEHTSELQSLMRISYAVFCLKQKNKH